MMTRKSMEEALNSLTSYDVVILRQKQSEEFQMALGYKALWKVAHHSYVRSRNTVNQLSPGSKMSRFIPKLNIFFRLISQNILWNEIIRLSVALPLCTRFYQKTSKIFEISLTGNFLTRN